VKKLTPELMGLLQHLKRAGAPQEAELIYRIKKGLLHGQFKLIVRGGEIERIEREIIYDNLSTSALEEELLNFPL
jgi:hypothetical protein